MPRRRKCKSYGEVDRVHDYAVWQAIKFTQEALMLARSAQARGRCDAALSHVMMAWGHFSTGYTEYLDSNSRSRLAKHELDSLRSQVRHHKDDLLRCFGWKG